jgi:hypothetical protein
MTCAVLSLVPRRIIHSCYNALGWADRHHSPVTLPHSLRVEPAQYVD